MAFAPLDDGAQVILEYGTSTFTWTNRFYVVKQGWTESDFDTLVDGLETAWGFLTHQPINSSQNFKGVTVYDLRGAHEPVYHWDISGATGYYTGELADKQTAVVVTFYSAHRGRSGRGRWYFSGIGEGQMTNGLFTQSFLTDVHTWVSDVRTVIQAAGFTHVIASAMQDGVALDPMGAHPVTSHTIRNGVPGSQNKRNQRP